MGLIVAFFCGLCFYSLSEGIADILSGWGALLEAKGEAFKNLKSGYDTHLIRVYRLLNDCYALLNPGDSVEVDVALKEIESWNNRWDEILTFQEVKQLYDLLKHCKDLVERLDSPAEETLEQIRRVLDE